MDYNLRQTVTLFSVGAGWGGKKYRYLSLSCLVQLRLESRAICFLQCSSVKTVFDCSGEYLEQICEKVPRKTIQLSTVAILFDRFFSRLLSRNVFHVLSALQSIVEGDRNFAWLYNLQVMISCLLQLVSNDNHSLQLLAVFLSFSYSTGHSILAQERRACSMTSQLAISARKGRLR